MHTENKIDCPALHKRSAGYPFGDRVPRTVRMLVTATADKIPGVELSHYPEATAGKSYRVWTNSHGAVVAVMDDGNRLGLRPAEFEVDSWHYLAAEPAPKPHPDPLAWMVGTAIWWTKEEAERDAAETGLPIVGLGPMNDRAAIELAESETLAAMAELAECETMADMVAEREWAEHVGTGDVSSKVEAAFTQLHNDLHEAGEKLAERDALLDRVVDHAKFWHDHPYAEVVEGIARDYKALSASAEPSALPDPLGCNECTHAECGKFDGSRQLECRAMADNACARPGISS